MRNKNNMHRGFTLAEMMIVMLILTIILAAFAPLMTKRKAVDLSSPWRWASNNSDIYYGTGNNQTAMIGQKTKATTDPNATLLIKSGDRPAITLRTEDTWNKYYTTLFYDEGTLCFGGYDKDYYKCGEGATSYGYRSLAHVDSSAKQNTAYGTYTLSGVWSSLDKPLTGSNNTAIGSYAMSKNIHGSNNVAIGAQALDSLGYYTVYSDTYKDPKYSSNNIAIGYSAGTQLYEGMNNIAIGSETSLGEGMVGSARDNVVIGHQAAAISSGSSIVGYKANYENSHEIGGVRSKGYVTAIGYQACRGNLYTYQGFGTIQGEGPTTCIGAFSGPDKTRLESLTNNKIPSGTVYIGNDEDFVFIPGYLKTKSVQADNLIGNLSGSSDKRLKNISGENKYGLDVIKNLKTYAFTFKEDKNKTPHIGLIAQDLQKYMPEAIEKDSKGYLSVKYDFITYTMFNAIKELDATVQKIVAQVKDITAKIVNVEKQIKALQKENKELKVKVNSLEKQNKAFETRLKNIESKL